MARLEELKPNVRVRNLVSGQAATVKTVEWLGENTVEVIAVDDAGGILHPMLSREDESRLELVDATSGEFPCDADPEHFRLAAEALRIRLAYLFDPLLAVNSSDVQPLPHQISAVYEEMLTRQPLRYLLADDPGAGKTIMAGLFIKELILRGDIERCLIVVPGNLCEQWQDELHDKFQLNFEIMTNDKLRAAVTGNWLGENDLVIARLDKLSRDEELRPKLKAVEWDLIVFDEAHKLSASYFGNKVNYTKRFELGSDLSPTTRHLLLMTATPHNGKEADFQLFLSLLDADRFEGKPREGAHRSDVTDLMRRLLKEQLVRFDGTPLFPARHAYTVRYELSELELRLYEEVTTYVREGFNRAEAIADERRRGNIGFALTILQRRLASSPAAILHSLVRRRERLEKRQEELETPAGKQNTLGSAHSLSAYGAWLSEAELEDLEDAPEDEIEQAEETVLSSASTAETIEELKAEIASLRHLEELARQVVRAGEDKKWQELSELLQQHELMFDETGARRKLVIFTEHKDTLHYLAEKIRTLLGDDESLVTISGSTGRETRKDLEARFKQDASTRILVATDAAGEGINLQRANLMVNYDLPWNPNRLEQRFGRIHRIGQTEVCHLWNLVAQDTREGQVFDRLLEKLGVESEALGGRVFDVLGTVFEGTSLRDLLIRAVRNAKDSRDEAMEEVFGDIDARLDREHLEQLLEERALAFSSLDSATVREMRDRMERARLMRLQPHFIAAFFKGAFEHLGGSMRRRERRRYEIRHVPHALRRQDRQEGLRVPVLQRYERVTFHPESIEGPTGREADLITPGHPLLSTVLDVVLERYRALLREGTVFVNRAELGATTPYALMMLRHSITEARTDRAGRRVTAGERMVMVRVYPDGQVSSEGPAPWHELDLPTPEEREHVASYLEENWLQSGLERKAVVHAAEHIVPEHLEEVRTRREAQVEKAIREVRARLSHEIAHWDKRAQELRAKEREGKVSRDINAENAARKRDQLQERLNRRLTELEHQRRLTSEVPVVLGMAFVVPEALLQEARGQSQEEPDAEGAESSFSTDPAARVRVERIAMDAVMRAEKRLGNQPMDVSSENRGYDIESRIGGGKPDQDSLRFIEVKGRVGWGEEIAITSNEMRYALNEPDRFILAIVIVDPDESVDGPYYLKRPFDNEPNWGQTETKFAVNALLKRAEAV